MKAIRIYFESFIVVLVLNVFVVYVTHAMSLDELIQANRCLKQMLERRCYDRGVVTIADVYMISVRNPSCGVEGAKFSFSLFPKQLYEEKDDDSRLFLRFFDKKLGKALYGSIHSAIASGIPLDECTDILGKPIRLKKIPDGYFFTPLSLKSVYFMVAELGRTENLSVLCNRVPENIISYINQQDEHGKTPLFYAVFGNKRYTVLQSLHHGADPEICDYEGFSPFQRAVFHGKLHALRAFFSYCTKNKHEKLLTRILNEHNLLHLACLCANQLCEKTARHLRIFWEVESIVKFLLDECKMYMDVNRVIGLSDGTKKTALDYLINLEEDISPYYQIESLCSFLQDHGAKTVEELEKETNDRVDDFTELALSCYERIILKWWN